MSFAYAQSLEKYDDVLLGFKFQYPNEWKRLLEKNYEDNGVVFNLSPLIGNNNILNNNVYVWADDFPISNNKTQKQYVREYLLKVFPGIDRETMKLNETELSGIPAMNVTYSDIERNTMMYFVYKDNTAYVIKYEAQPTLFDKWLPQVNALIRSFQIT
jgi:hypothetical protein